MKRFKSIRFLFVFVVAGLIFIGSTLQAGYTFIQFHQTMTSSIEAMLRYQSEEVTNKLGGQLVQFEITSKMLSQNIETMQSYHTDHLIAFIGSYIRENPLINGSGFWFAPGQYQADMKYYGPYVYKDEKNTVVTTWEYSNPQYDYFQYAWYKQAIAAKGKVIWSAPYMDEVSKTGMITCSTAIMKNGQPVGVTTVDVNLKHFDDYVSKIKVGKEGYAFLVSADGYYLGTKDRDKNLVKKITEEENPALQELGRKIIATDQLTLFQTSALGQDSFVAVEPIRNTKINLVLVYPEKEAYAATYRTLWTSLTVFIVVILLMIVILVFFFNRKIGRPMDHLLQVSGVISKGDLTVKAPTGAEDEISLLANGLNGITNNLRTIIHKILQKTEQVAASSEELTASADQSSKAANEVAQAISEVAHASKSQQMATSKASLVVENINATIVQISAQAGKAVNCSEVTSKQADSGAVEIEKAVKQMNYIEETVRHSSQVVSKLGERSKEIGQIIDAISGIAGQTNLLALNAAIEAARAGEQGRGFAVVAEEVRKLAEQSQDAAKEIAALIGEIQQETENAVTAMQQGNQEVKTGTQVVSAAGKAFRDIVDMVSEVSSEIQNIAVGIGQLGNDSKEIVKTMEEIDQLSCNSARESENVSAATQQQLASMEEIAAASQALAHLAQELQDSVQKFRLQ